MHVKFCCINLNLINFFVHSMQYSWKLKNDVSRQNDASVAFV